MINVKDVLAKLDAEDSARFAACEKAIDAALLKFDGTETIVDISHHGLRRKVVEKLREAYRVHGGWSVEIMDNDQRGPGPYLRFCAPVTP